MSGSNSGVDTETSETSQSSAASDSPPPSRRTHGKGSSTDSQGGRGDPDDDEANDFEDDPDSEQAQAALQTIAEIRDQVTQTGVEGADAGSDTDDAGGGTQADHSPGDVPEIRQGTTYDSFSSQQAVRTAAHAIQNNQIGKRNWQLWNNFFDKMTEAELEEAAITALSTKIDRTPFGSSPLSYESNSLETSDDSPSHYDRSRANVASCLTRIGRDDPARQREAATRLIEEVPAEVTEAAAELAATWCPDASVRREMYETHVPDTGEHGDKEQFVMQFDGSHERRAKSLLSRYVTSTKSPPSQFARAALREIEPNDNAPISEFTGGLAARSVEPTDEFRETVETLREETAEYIREHHDGEVTLWRGVKKETTSNASLESWSSRRSAAKKYDGQAVLEATFEPGDVLATHEIDQHEDWAYNRFPEEQEWTVLGGPVAQSVPEDMRADEVLGV